MFNLLVFFNLKLKISKSNFDETNFFAVILLNIDFIIKSICISMEGIFSDIESFLRLFENMGFKYFPINIGELIFRSHSDMMKLY